MYLTGEMPGISNTFCPAARVDGDQLGQYFYAWRPALIVEFGNSFCPLPRKSGGFNKGASSDLVKFRDITMQSIIEDNKQGMENINGYLRLLDTTLFRDREIWQNYYLEPISPKNDFADHLAKCAEQFRKKGYYTTAIRLYSLIVSRFNYYQVVNVGNQEIFQVFDSFSKVIKYLDNEMDAKDYQEEYWYACLQELTQMQLFLDADLTNNRENEDWLGRYFSPNFLGSYYQSLFENKLLDSFSKQRLYRYLYDEIRMVELNFRFRSPNIEDLLNGNEGFSSKKQSIQEFIYVEPIALMLIRMFENNDFTNLKLFWTMNISNSAMAQIKLLCVLSLVNKISRSYVETNFVVQQDTTKKLRFIGKMFMLDEPAGFSEGSQELLDCYNMICTWYLCENADSPIGKERRTKAYASTELRFSKRVVDGLFCRMVKPFGEQKKFAKEERSFSLADNNLEFVLNALFSDS